MKTFYNSLSFSHKMSFNASMNNSMKDFLSHKFEILPSYENSDLLISDIYFYWIRFSAEYDYKWCSDTSDFLLSDDFFDETKITLFICFCKQKLKFQKSLQKNKLHFRK